MASELGLQQARVVADCNNIVYVFAKAASCIVSVVNHLMKWASTGIVMVPVCDGAIRPVCKQATNSRIARSEKNRIKAFQIRKAIRKAKQRLINDNLNEGEQAALQAEIKKMESNCKRKETQASSKLPKNFASGLKRELFDNGANSIIPATGGFVDNVVVAEFQADLYMAAQLVNRSAVMTMTKDCDIPLLSGGIIWNCLYL